MQQKTVQPNVQSISFSAIQMGPLLGHGGYGDVYKAQWYGTEVAVKQLHLKTLSPTLTEEFLHEANVMSQCQFPNIIKLYGICTEVGHNSLIMEYMPKGSLRNVLENKAEDLSWEIRWEIALDIGNGVAYLHGRNILHRDLKSLNILLSADYHAKISDFGLSKIKLESSSSTKNKAGTVRWCAPETFKRGFKPASSMDIYSYGMVLWEIASRELPFADAQNEITVMGWIKDGEKETIPGDCPKGYGEVIENCWLEANKRPSAEAIIKTLTQAKPVPAPVPIPAPSKPYVEKSWHFDPATERKASHETDAPYQILEATEKDKQKVVVYYQHHPVPGYEIASVKVIYNRDFNQGFEIQMRKLQKRHNNPGFAPKWPNENNPWRQATHGQFENLSNPYTDPDYPQVKLLPLWHGTKPEILDSIFSIGYANLATTDSGFFGKGIYGAYEAEYPHRVYSKGALILNWVAVFSTYPTIDGDMPKLKEKGNYQNYDAHFIPVVPANPSNPNEMNYYPCKPNQKNTYTEVVVFESSSCLPRYMIELQASGPQANKLNTIIPAHTPQIPTTPKTNAVQQGPATPAKPQKVLLQEGQGTLVQNLGLFQQSPVEQKNLEDEAAEKNFQLLLKWVTEGHLLEAEKLLQNNPKLALMRGTVTDLSGRTFKDITAFQYAAWALDVEMWDLILKYLDKQSAGEQLADLEMNPQKYSNCAAHYDISLYTTKIDEHIKNYKSWDNRKREQHWQKEVGGAQRQFPAWLVYAMCEKGKDVAWVKQDLKNMKVTRQYDEGHLKWWFEHEYNGGKLGRCWTVIRGVLSINLCGQSSDFYEAHFSHDHENGQSVKSTKAEALNSLKTQLSNKNITPKHF